MAGNRASNRWLVLAGVFALGVSAVITQLVMMREMLCAFGGNELVLGIVLGNWLLLSGVGAALGRWCQRLTMPLTAFALSLLVVAWLPWHQLFFLRLLRDIIFVHGAAVDVTGTFVTSLAFLAPFCLISGFMLALASHILAGQENNAGIGRVYVADCIGGVAGGAFFSFVLIHFCGHLRTLQGLAVATFLLACTMALRADKRLLLLCGLIAIEFSWMAVARKDWDLFLAEREYADQRVLLQANSPYGRLVVVDFGQQVTFVENGVPVIATHNVQQAEETVHYAMAQRPKTQRVLLIGGGVSGTAREILKYGVAEVTYVELDPLIIEAGKRFLPENLADPRIKVVNTDGRLFVKRALPGQFDVVIVDLPDPSTSQINRFYTAEFFGEVKRTLAKEGVLSFGLGQYQNYISAHLAHLLGTAHATLRQSFRNTLLIPGGRVFFLASDGDLSSDIARRVETAGVPTQLVNNNYLKAMLTPDRLADMQRAVAEPAALNTDFNPVLYFHQLRHWMSQFRVRFGLFEGALLVVLTGYLVTIRRVPLVIFVSGFAASALEVVLLLGFQILYGSVYRQLGIIVTVFMAGLAVGAWAGNRWRANSERAGLVTLAFAIAGLAVLLPWMLRGLALLGAGPLALFAVQAGIALLTFVLAVLVGMEFPVAARVQFEGGALTAARLYTADFVGAFLGALLASTLLIPVLGVTVTCLVTAALNAVAGAVLLRGSKS